MRQSLSSQISGEKKKMGYPILYAHGCSFYWELCTYLSQDGQALLAKPKLRFCFKLEMFGQIFCIPFCVEVYSKLSDFEAKKEHGNT